MEELLKSFITGFPNLAVGIVALYWSARLIERMVTNQEKLTDKLLEMVAKCETLSNELATVKYSAESQHPPK